MMRPKLQMDEKATAACARICALVLLVLAAYLPALRAGYIWDDDKYVTENATLRSAAGLKEIWLNPYATPQYYPLVHSTYWIEYRFVGVAPFTYHLDNILLHAINASLLFILLRRLQIQPAWMIAGIFALHPVHVESVAWVTERKNVLSGAFYLLALLSYMRFAGLDNGSGAKSSELTRPRLLKFYFLAFLFFIGALLSKTVTFSMPCVAALIIFWKRSRLRWRDLLPLAPMFAVGLGMGFVTAWIEKHHVGAQGPEWSLSLAQRCMIAGRAPWFYVGKLLWPFNLSFVYPRWVVESRKLLACLSVAAMLLLVAALWRLARRGRPGALCAYLTFLVTLSPALGFVNVFPFRYSFVADHFQYLASIGLFVPVCCALELASLRLDADREHKRPSRLLAGLLLPLLVLLTFKQASIYANEEVLWLDTLAKNPKASIAYNNLATFYAEQANYFDARQCLETGLRYAPGDPDLLTNLGGVLVSSGDDERAVRILSKAREHDPMNPWLLNNLGLSLAHSGRQEEAAALFRQALEIRPEMFEAYNNLAAMLESLGRIPEAIETLKKMEQLDPNNRLIQAQISRLKNATPH